MYEFIVLYLLLWHVLGLVSLARTVLRRKALRAQLKAEADKLVKAIVAYDQKRKAEESALDSPDAHGDPWHPTAVTAQEGLSLSKGGYL